MLRRKIYDFLLEWKKREHQCLLVKGLRQIGKTFIIKKFGEDNYRSVIYVNFAEDIKLKKIFDEEINIDSIVSALEFSTGVKSIVGDTLIIFDEIQECNRARTSLKSFTIDGRYDVIASGSLLGINDVRNKKDNPPSILPMGYEEYYTMYSLDFEEFLWANGFLEKGIEEIKNCIRERREIPPIHHAKAEKCFRDFMIVGGMPKAVSEFVKKKSFLSSEEQINKILEAAKTDVNKYNEPKMAIKTSECFDSIPSQLSESNKKFTYSRVTNNPHTKSEKYEGNLLWIKNAGYGNFCFGLKQISHPLNMQKYRDAFKVYVSDTGLLMGMIGRDAMKAIFEENYDYNMGAVAENVIAECIMKSGYDPVFYRKTNGKNKMEIDFVLEFEDELVAIEVKSGKKRESPSIGKVDAVFKVDRKIKFEKSNIHVDEDGVEHYPFYAAAFIEQIRPPSTFPF